MERQNLSMKNKTRLGFSLLELSVTLAAIGVIVIGITQGTIVVQKAKLRSARALTQNSPVNVISGVTLWLEPTLPQSLQNSALSYNVKDGDSIKNWYDINPSDMQFTATIGYAPTYKLNGIGGLPTLFFDAASNATSGKALSISRNDNFETSTFTLFVVTQALEQTSDWGTVIMSRDGTAGDLKGYNIYKQNTNATWQFWTGYASSWNQTTATIEFNKPAILTAYRSSTQAKFYKNGGTPNTLSASYTPNTSSSAFCIGYNCSTLYYDGYISEIIYFNRALSDNERKSVENYLSKKYGIVVT